MSVAPEALAHDLRHVRRDDKRLRIRFPDDGTQRTDLRPLQLKLYYLIGAASESFQTEGVTTVAMTNPEVLKAACIIFAAVPIICVYPFVQKYFVQGTMVGAVKG